MVHVLGARVVSISAIQLSCLCRWTERIVFCRQEGRLFLVWCVSPERGKAWGMSARLARCRRCILGRAEAQKSILC